MNLRPIDNIGPSRSEDGTVHERRKLLLKGIALAGTSVVAGSVGLPSDALAASTDVRNVKDYGEAQAGPSTGVAAARRLIPISTARSGRQMY
jgi:hypothetical protein